MRPMPVETTRFLRPGDEKCLFPKRFLSKVDTLSDAAAGGHGCWIWLAAIDKDGYGFTRIGKRSAVRAHRISYECCVGPIEDDLVIDHLCRHRICVNPRHLEAVSNKINLLRGESFSAVNARKDVCDNGHPFSGPNLISHPNGHRSCRECRRVRGRERKKERWRSDPEFRRRNIEAMRALRIRKAGKMKARTP